MGRVLQPDRYSRQTRFSPLGLAGQERLAAATVAIVGCGALGTFHAAALARAGIGRLKILDRDIVEWSNLQRQWLFDEQDYKLKKIDEEGKLLQETVDTRILLDDGLAPSKIIDRENFVYIYDTAKGFYIFDYYGGYKNKIPLLNWHNVEVNANTIYGFGNNKLYSYQVNTSVQKEYKLPAFFGKYNAVKVMNGKVYLLKSESLDIYQVK